MILRSVSALRSTIHIAAVKRAKYRFLVTALAYQSPDSGDPHYDSSYYKSRSFIDEEHYSELLNLDLYPQDLSSASPKCLNKAISFCAKETRLDVGVQLHSYIIKIGLTSNVYIGSALVDMYRKCGQIFYAQKVFDEMPERNGVTWTSLMSGYLHVFPETTVSLFVKMIGAGIAATSFSLLAVLVACSHLEAKDVGSQVHCLCVKTGFCDDVVIGTGLLDMYSKCCEVNDSRRVFDELEERNVITWTSMVSSYAQNGMPDEAMVLVREMMRSGLRLNCVTYNSLLSSFLSLNYLNHSKQIHCLVIQEGLDTNVYIAVTLLTVYSKCSSSLEDFRKVCLSVSKWDTIAWNAVIAGFSNLGYDQEALKCFSAMRQEGFDIDFFSFTSILRVIGNCSAAEMGKQMHTLILKTGYASNLFLQNALISMYARCGELNDSKKVFFFMNKHDVISWNSLLSACAHHGHGKQAMELFEQMRETETKPDGTTFLVLLSACSHIGLVDKGLEYFDLMLNNPLLEPPRVEHYAAIVDLFGRAGYLNEAEAFINTMPMKPSISVYKALLSACQLHGNKEIAIRSARNVLEMWPDDPATYILLSNVFKMGNDWDDSAGLWKLMCDRGVKKKKPGYSWV